MEQEALNERDELLATQVALKRVTEEMEKMRQDMLVLQNRGVVCYALGYDPESFKKMKFTESLQWVHTTLSVRLKKEVEKYPEFFRLTKLIGGVKDVDGKACAGYNQGVPCRKKWHIFNRQTGRYNGVEELRLHCCALCLEALGTICGHPLVNCPWIKESTWSVINA